MLPCCAISVEAIAVSRLLLKKYALSLFDYFVFAESCTQITCVVKVMQVSLTVPY
jgi:hypothetical protein